MQKTSPRLKLTAVRLPQPLIQKVKIRCVKEQTTFQEAVEAALEAWLKAPRKEMH